eukprot:CAMPEP_0197519636 /NCGR_PEP_ID=MMETSP1318-20131121/4915_1 /TAXON_ID=552666 /ORGANISM="Partenskyella glossopodia, Strain RCC365" /LENGTH=236 /DNA_ID=CAMNT_0043070739 /DNA_START=342 /DNA_END=1052 /DNA_ORIENTATION=-
MAGIFQVCRLARLNDFPESKDQLGIVNREVPAGSSYFFKTLLERACFDEAAGKVCKSHAKTDIRRIVQEKIPKEFQNKAFYETWLSDMAEVCKTFCDTQKSETITFWVGSDRTCAKYHVDWVPYRMLVTYHGKGTEYLPDDVYDREAFFRIPENDVILEDSKAAKFLQPWDVALFRGGPDGIVHRSPDAARETPTMLMRLDRKEYFDVIVQKKVILQQKFIVQQEGVMKAIIVNNE